MRKVLAVAALSLAALFAGAPPAAADDTRCGAPFNPADPEPEPEVLGPVVVDNVIVPSGTLCVLAGTQVLGNALAEPASGLFLETGTNVRGSVEVKEEARARASESTIGGNYKCDHCTNADGNGLRVGGSMQIVDSPGGGGIAESVIGGNVEIVGTPSGFGSTRIAGNEIGGNVKFKKNDGITLGILDNTIAGDLQIFENESGVGFDFIDNTVAGNMQVFKNGGSAVISGNQVRQNLQCKGNEPPPCGGNTARKKQGQCRFL